MSSAPAEHRDTALTEKHVLPLAGEDLNMAKNKMLEELSRRKNEERTKGREAEGGALSGKSLTPEETLTECLQQLVTGESTHELLVVALNEETNVLSLLSSSEFSGNPLPARFQNLVSFAAPDAPRIFFLRIDFRSNSPRWLSVSWTPTSACSPLRRTLIDFAAWHLRSSLPSPRLIQEYYASNVEALTYSAYCGALRRAYRARESFVKHFDLVPHGREFGVFDGSSSPSFNGYSQNSSFSTPATLSPSFAVDFDESFSAQVTLFKENVQTCLEILVDDSAAVVCALPCIYDTPELLQQHVARNSEPRYYLLHHVGVNALIWYCPDTASRRDRVLYAACKQYVLEKLMAQNCVQIPLLLDIRSSSEISESLFEMKSFNSLLPEEERLLKERYAVERQKLLQQQHGRNDQTDSTNDPLAALTASNVGSIALILSLPAKPAPSGDAWAEGDLLIRRRDKIEAWRRAARLPPASSVEAESACEPQ